MGFCARPDDQLVKKVFDLYNANIVRAPGVGLDPYEVVVVKDESDRVEQIGELDSLLTRSSRRTLPPPEQRRASDLTGTRSSNVELDLGLDLAGALLAAFSVPVSGATLNSRLWGSDLFPVSRTVSVW